MAQLKDLLVTGASRFLNSIYGDLNGNILNYGECSSTLGIQAKTVTTNGVFELIPGSEVTIKFINGNSASSPTLNVNDTGAKPIYFGGSAVSEDYILPNYTYILRYNGTQWDIIGGSVANKFTTAQTITLTGDTTGSASSQAGWSIATTTDRISTVGDKRSEATTPNSYVNKIIFQGIKSNTAIGNPSSDTYSFLIGLRGWGDSTAGKSHELAFNNTGINWRIGATTSWESWKQLVFSNNSGVGSTTQPVYISTAGEALATTYSLSATVNAGTATRVAYYSGANAISSGSITSDGGYLGNVSYLSVNTAHQTGYRAYINGNSYFNIGSSDNVTNKNFIIYGNNRYLSLGGAGIQAYTGVSTSTTTGTFYVNYNGGTVQIGQSSSTATKVIIDSNTSNSTNILEVKTSNTSSSGGFLYATAALASNMVADSNIIQVFGRAESAGNCGYIGYNWHASNNNANFITLGHYSNDHLVRIYKNGAVAIGAATNSYKLYVNGTGYFTGIGTFASTVESTSTATGSLITSGGMGIAKDVFIGGNILQTAGAKIQKLTLLPSTAGPFAEGWKRVCLVQSLYSYANFQILLTGVYNTGLPTLANLSVTLRNGSAKIKVLHEGFAGNIQKVRLVKSGTNTCWLDVYIGAWADGTTMGDQYATFIGNVNITNINTTLTDASSGTSLAEVDLTTTINTITQDGTANRFAYYDTATHIKNTNIITDGNYISNISYLTVNANHQTNYEASINGVTNSLAYTLNGATSAGTNYITGTAGKIFFGNDNFQIDSLNTKKTYINYNTANDVILVGGPNQGKVGIGTTSPAEKLQVSGGLLAITNNSNTVKIGSQNGSYTHIYNSASIPFIVNNSFLTSTGNLGNETYPWNNIYIGKTGTKNIYYVGSKATNSMIRFLDNTTDTGGNGISIGGGGTVIIGSGEAASAFPSTANQEVLYLLSDGALNIEANANTIGNRIGGQITTAGNFVPVKAEATNNNAQTLGVSGNRWKAIYVGSADTYGSSTQPIYWNAGVPSTTTYALKATVNGGTKNYLAYYSSATEISKATFAHLGYTTGSTATTGYEELVLGNSTATGTDNNAYGRLALYSPGTKGGYIVAAQSSTWYTHTLPVANGWLVTAGNGSTTGAGGARQPVYISTGGIATAGEVTFDTLTANRLMWTKSANKPYAGDHYVSSAKIAINSTSEPTQNFYVEGTSYFHGNTSVSGTFTADGTVTFNNSVSINAFTSAFTSTISIDTGAWSGTTPYTATAAVQNITSNHKPIIGMYIPDTLTGAAYKAMWKAYGCIDRAVTDTNKITFYCYNKKPAVKVNMVVKGI